MHRCLDRLVSFVTRPILLGIAVGFGLFPASGRAAAPAPAPQSFRQEVPFTREHLAGAPRGAIQLLDLQGDQVRVFVTGHWHERKGTNWVAATTLDPRSPTEFTLIDNGGKPATVNLPWADVRQIVRGANGLWLATEKEAFRVENGRTTALGWNGQSTLNQVAADATGKLYLAAVTGLFEKTDGNWQSIPARDGLGRGWATENVLGVAVAPDGALWFASKAGVGCRTGKEWRFYEGKDGLPWNDFTGIAIGPDGAVWFGTHLGAIRFQAGEWHYREGPLWLPNNDVRQVAAANGLAWFATADGVSHIDFRPYTLADKAALYEDEISRYVKRTPYGYVAEAPLRTPGDRSTANPQDSDNDGLWTAMYGAGECFGYAATKDPALKARAAQAFEALRFLQKVTQGGDHAPPKGYIARTIRPIDWPDPNVGRREDDVRSQQHDLLWKIYEPRWPKSADGRWYWKSDTSSDELDGHFFFYPLYFDFCAETEAEKDRVREVVRDLADHLVSHGFLLIDHDGKPTRWGVFGPEYLNGNPLWWPERGLNSLSILSYLAVATYVTGDAKYEAASKELVEKHGYAQNAMYSKVQHGPGSGNQSDDEMAFMCYYSLLRHSHNEALKAQIRYSFFRYWANEAPEMNPFFNFAYAALNLDATVTNPWGRFPLQPWPDWFEDSMATLRGFPLDRLDWAHHNRHRLDLRLVGLQQSVDLYEARRGGRGYRVNGKVLPVENRHFGHWNTDPWHFDYGGNGGELAAGTVYLLPYYLGLYHGFIAKPTP